MDDQAKIQIFQDVVAGSRHPSELKAVLPDAGVSEPNWIAAAVDHIVAQRIGKSASSFRFKIIEAAKGDKKKETTIFTPWIPEMSQLHAPLVMAQVRQEHPNAKIGVERK